MDRFMFSHRHEPDLEALLRDKHRNVSYGSRRIRAPQAPVYTGRALPAFYRDPTPALLAVYENITQHLSSDWRTQGLGYDIDYVELVTTQLSLPATRDPDLDMHCRGIGRLIDFACTEIVAARTSETLPDPPADAYGLLLWFGVALRIARSPDKSAAITRINNIADIADALETASKELVPFVTLRDRHAAATHAAILAELRKIPEPAPDPEDKHFWEETP